MFQLQTARSFEIARHEEFGTIGLRPVDTPHADPLSGMAVAHDLLEHEPGDSFDVPGELKALGAMIVVRDFGLYWHNQGSHDPDPASHIVADLAEVYRHVVYERMALPGTPGALGHRTLDDDEAERIVMDATRGKPFRDWFEDFEDDVYPRDREINTMRAWMRLGFRIARHRYRAQPGWRLCEAFTQIENDADAFVRDYEDWPGLRVAFRLDLERMRLTIEANEDGYVAQAGGLY